MEVRILLERLAADQRDLDPTTKSHPSQSDRGGFFVSIAYVIGDMAAPTIYSRSESGLRDASDTDMFGLLGEIYAITVHHSAGPRAPTKARCQELNRLYQIEHIRKGWGDIGYHFCVDDLGRVYKLRNVKYKGAHVGGWNTGNVGIMFHGNYMINDLTVAQKETIEWLFKGGLNILTGESEAGFKLARGHREWPGHTSNECPGTDLMASWNYRRNQDFN